MNLRHSFILGLGALGLVAACGSDNKASPDAPAQGSDAPKAIDAKVFLDAPPADSPPAVADTSCLTTPPPTSTTATTITLTGSISEQSLSGGDVTGATVTAKDVNDANLVSTADPNPKTITGTSGDFTFTTATALKPVDGHLIGAKTGLRTTYLYPANPLVADTANASIIMLSDSTFGQLEGLGGASGAEGDGQGSIGVAVMDCAGNFVEGATVEVSQGSSHNLGTVRYGRPFSFGGQTIPGGVPNPDAMSTDMTGLAFIFGVPSTDGGKETTITATQNGVSWRAHVVKVFPKSLTTTIDVP